MPSQHLKFAVTDSLSEVVLLEVLFLLKRH